MLRRRAAWILVVGAHGLIGWFGLEILRRAAPGEGLLEAPLVVQLLARSETPRPKDAVRPRPAGVRARSPPRVPIAPQDRSDRADMPPTPSIDWNAERQRIAQEAARALPSPQDPACDQHENPGSLRPRCNTPPRFDWRPNPKRVEFSGGLPFVRIGKRCGIGLGFMGCAIGHLPDANGHLLDGLKDPARVDSSVPDVPR